MATTLTQRSKLSGYDEPAVTLGAAEGSGRRRRMPEMAAGMLLVIVCALGALWWQAAGTDRTPVLALRNPIERGQRIERADLQVVNVEVDHPIASLADTQSGEVLGSFALTDLPAGTIVTTAHFSAGDVLRAGEGVVGVALDAGEAPSLTLATGDAVSVVLTSAPGDPRAFTDTVDPVVLVERAEVVDVAPIGVQGGLFVSIQVSEDDAARVATAASADRVRLIEVSNGEDR